jgi:hypothetical protein
MNEQLLREVLHRGDVEIEVSDTDLHHAAHRFHRRREDLDRRRRGWMTAGVAAAAVVAVSAGILVGQALGEPEAVPAERDDSALPEGRLPITLENLAGLYLVPENHGWLWAFTTEGTFEAQNPGLEPDNQVSDVPLELSGSTIVLTDDMCDFEAELWENGLLNLTASRVNECPFRVGETITLTRLSPASDVGSTLAWPQGVEVRNERVGWIGSLRGVYVQQGTGRLLLVAYAAADDRATYRLDDDGGLFHAPDDEGTLRLADDGSLVLTSSVDSVECAAGSTTILEGPRVRSGPQPFPALDRVLEIPGSRQPGCALHEDLAGSWVRVS